MATYNGADKRLQYLFSHIGDGSNMSGTAQPTGIAVDNTLYIQYDANDGSVVALWVYLNGTWTEVETSGGNLYGTDEPTEEADEGALYIQYDSTDYSVTALWAYIGSGWREISTGGGGSSSGGARYTETVLWSGSQSTTGTITLSDSVKNYDLITIIWSPHPTNTNIYKIPSYLPTSKITDYSSSYQFELSGLRGLYGSNSAPTNTTAFVSYHFSSETELSIDEVGYGSLASVTILQVIGIKWEIQETALIYSEEEREVGVWTNGKPLYQKNITATISSTVQWIDTGLSTSDIDQITYRGGYIERSGGGFEMLPSGDPQGLVGIDVFLSTVISGKWAFLYRTNSSDLGSGTAHITIRYTKSADVAGSGTYITTGGYAHHYSTTEHVVGTWVDGSTLYEITVATGGSVPSDATTLIDRRAMSGVAYDVLLYLK